MDGLERLEKEAVEMNNHNVIFIFDSRSFWTIFNSCGNSSKV